MPLDRRIRTAATIALGGYAVFVAVIGFWPTPVDRPFDPALFRILDTMRGVGVAPNDAYDVIEFTANVAFFVVPAILVVLIVGRRLWWIAPVSGLLCSITIELAQHFLLPHRFGTLNDVIANTLGSLIGCAIGLLVLARRPQPRRS
jgi:VanZ like family